MPLPLIRFIIAVAATLELAYFIIELPFPLGKMLDPAGRWFDILSGLCMAVVAPLLALAAAGRAAMDRRPGVAAILLGVAPLVYWAPLIAAVTGFMIYGF